MDGNTVKIIVAIIGLIGTIFGSVLTYLIKSKQQAIEDAKREQKQNDLFDKLFDDIEGIKKRLDTHNHYAEKITSVEKSIASINKDLEYLRKEKQ